MRPILIVECCQNHNGDREILKKMIWEASAAGADYVKLQTIRSSELTRRERFEEGQTAPDRTVQVIKRPYGAEFERLAGLDLTLEDEAWFVDECLRAGIGSMTTTFTRAGAWDVKDLGYEAVKVASYDCPSYPLLKDLKRWWSRIFVSTGACFDHEIETAAKILAGSEFTFLHCVTIYPTPMTELHLRRMEWLRRFTPRVGLSEHTKTEVDGLWASKIALGLGADCIERHYTVLEVDQSRDGPVSITPKMIAELREFADRPRAERMEILSREYPQWEVALGQSKRKMAHAEMLNRDYYRGRFASKVDGRDVYNWEDVSLRNDE